MLIKKDINGKLTSNTEAGVAIMIHNKHLGKIQNIDPVDDRLICLELKGTVTTTFQSTYKYTAKDHEKNETREIKCT